jgi:hypothetical protein
LLARLASRQCRSWSRSPASQLLANTSRREFQMLDPLIQLSLRDTGIVELGPHVPGTEPELQAAVRQQLGGGGLAEQQRRIPTAGSQHVAAQPDPLRDRAGRDERIERAAMPR